MSQTTTMFRPDLVRTVALNVGYLLTVLIAACGFHKWQTGVVAERRTASAQDLPVGENSRGEYRLYGAKTSYDQVREKNVQQVNVPGCIPKQFWLLSRHGARYPGPFEMGALTNRLPTLRDLILENVRSGRGRLNRSDVDDLVHWRLEFEPSSDNQLTPGGEIEMKELAQRFKERFPTLLGCNFSSETYRFRHTDSHRTADSARHFATGLFGSAFKVDLPEPVKDDPVIKFYKTCRKWKEEVDDNDESRKERTRFRRGPEMQKVVQNVSTRLGFARKLPFDDVHLMFTMCRFESATHSGRSSPWCSVFRRDELEVMEYDEDLDYYWTDGYGYPINYEQACPPIKDFIDHFRAAMKSETNTPLGVFRFSHSGLLLKVYARLGMFRDATPPRADNFREQSARKWRSSLIDPFTANLALVLFKCSDGHKLMAFVQERPIVLPGCDRVLCPMETVLKNYAALADTCDVAEICDGYLENYAHCRRRSKKNARRAAAAVESNARVPSSNPSDTRLSDRNALTGVCSPSEQTEKMGP